MAREEESRAVDVQMDLESDSDDNSNTGTMKNDFNTEHNIRIEISDYTYFKKDSVMMMMKMSNQF